LPAAGNITESRGAFEEGEKLALEQNDRNCAAWCRIFIGKAKVKRLPDLKEQGRQEMLDAAGVITEIGEEWEREAMEGILQSAGVKR